jgi:membrane associated rhomboid family serine protease
MTSFDENRDVPGRHEDDTTASTAARDAIEPTLLVAHGRRQAEEWALVLTAEGMRPVVRRTESGFALELPPHEIARARQTLDHWREENRRRPPPPETQLVPSRSPLDLAVAYAIALCLLAFFVALDGRSEVAHLLERGSAHARRIVSGEYWRVFTALTLHKDLLHVLGNTLIGGLFLASLAGRVGAGLAFGCAVASGALGNLANAMAYDDAHDSIGASTAVFGVLGLLSGLEAWRRRRLALPWQGAWLPLGAGLGVLAMLGAGGGRVDFGAHLFGLLAGMLLGLAMAPWVSPRRPGPAVQLAAGLLALIAILGAWARALA